MWAESVSVEAGLRLERERNAYYILTSADAQEGQASGTHNISFYCDDIHRTVAELQERGVEFTGEIADHGYGLVT